MLSAGGIGLIAEAAEPQRPERAAGAAGFCRRSREKNHGAHQRSRTPQGFESCPLFRAPFRICWWALQGKRVPCKDLATAAKSVKKRRGLTVRVSWPAAGNAGISPSRDYFVRDGIGACSGWHVRLARRLGRRRRRLSRRGVAGGVGFVNTICKPMLIFCRSESTPRAPARRADTGMRSSARDGAILVMLSR